MAEPARDPEVERRIREHVEAIDRALATRGVPPAERRSVTGDIEIQIRDMLATTAAGAPTLADVEAVLRKLDAPESYAEDVETAPFEKEAPTKRGEPEFHAFRKRLRTIGLFICIAGLPIGIALNIPYVWILSIVGIIVGSIKLAAAQGKPHAPESYHKDAEAAPFEKAPFIPQAESPRFSRTAIFGAVWGSIVFVALAIVLCTGGGYHGTVSSLPWRLKIPVITLLALYVTAPFAATILGWVAVSQIRRSKGRLYGMGLALASGLFYPLLALDTVMTVAIWYPVAGIAEWSLPNVNTHPLRYLFSAFDLLSAGALCAFVDYRVVRWTWGKISAPIPS